jgi:Tfp pilus assembly protein PilO
MTFAAKNEKARGLIVTVVAIAGTIGYVLGLFLPGQKAIARKRTELKDKQQFVATAGLTIASASGTEKDLQVARSHVELWRQNASAESGGVLLLGDLAALAAEAGVSLHRLTPQEPLLFDTVRQQRLDLEIEGSFANVIRFLQGVEERPETIWIPKLDMQASQEDAQKVQCGVSLVVFADNRGNSG